MRKHVMASLAVFAIGAITLCACGSDSDTPGAPSVDAGIDQISPPKDSGFGGIDAPEEKECKLGCSVDLHSIVDCNGAFVSTCATGTGCAGGTCVDPCEAAKAGKSSMGCEYYEHERTPYETCNALFIVNAWDTPVTLAADAHGVPIDLSTASYSPSGSGDSIEYTANAGVIPPGEMTMIFLRGTCPGSTIAALAPPQWTDPGDPTSIGGHALHITSNGPIMAYDMQPFGGAASFLTSASLLLPVGTWDTNYVAVTPVSQNNDPGFIGAFSPGISIIASEDGTDVTLLPNVYIVGNGGTVGASNSNEPRVFSLNKGDVLRLTQDQDLTGTIISSTKPIGLWAEEDCISIDGGACDEAHQQIPAVSALGSEYAAVRYPNRAETEESPPWRIVGLVDGTVLTWDPAPPSEGAPTTVDSGQAVTFRGTGPFVVRSQDKDHPFYMNAYMTGGQDFGGIGDPEFVNIVPAAQFMSSYTFFTDPSYSVTDLVFTRAKGDKGFADVSLDCVGPLTGWKPVGTTGKYEYAYVNFTDAGCVNGVHTAKSDEGFSLTVWGLDQYVSYAYPAAMSVRAVNTVVVPPVPR